MLEKRVVHLDHPHTDESRGDSQLKEFKYGNTTVVIHSPLVHMNIDEKKKWFKDELEKGNKVLKQMVFAVAECYRKS
ncbi:hypothetical protein KZX50_09675 [Bacillus infantis]|uniref:hypothetical protein n=1 Tax=Bacillus infantis TaxID=324767 RepID=UPI00200308E8|nr:hypothetical protein [Bacillus infantis]MCK6205704.1 hypothetical protein [Bacillus infantis]